MFLADYLYLDREDLAFIVGLGLRTLNIKTEIMLGFRPDFKGGRSFELDQILVEVRFDLDF